MATPTFEEFTEAAVVTFRVQVGVGGTATPEQATGQVTAQVVAALAAAVPGPVTPSDLQAARLRHRGRYRVAVLDQIVAAGWLERTVADKLRSPNQRDRLAADGRAVLQQRVSA